MILHGASKFTPLDSQSLLFEFNDCSIHWDSIEESMPNVSEFDKPTFPNHVVRKGFRVENAGQFSVLTKTYGNAPIDCHSSTTENTGQHSTEIHLIPSVTLPGLFVLIAPMPLLSSIQSFKRHQHGRNTFPLNKQLTKIFRFFRVEIIFSITIDRML